MRDEQGGLDVAKLTELAAIPEIKMFEIKLSQGAKPGKGGILPGEKVTEVIACTRGIPAGQDSISPRSNTASGQRLGPPRLIIGKKRTGDEATRRHEQLPQRLRNG